MRISRLAGVAFAGTLFLGLAATEARAEFSEQQMNDFVSMVNELETDGKKQEKAVAKINKTAAKEYPNLEKEFKGFAKIVKTAQKAFPSSEGVSGAAVLLIFSTLAGGGHRLHVVEPAQR
jgi:ERCC4-type nuclease